MRQTLINLLIGALFGLIGFFVAGWIMDFNEWAKGLHYAPAYRTFMRFAAAAVFGGLSGFLRFFSRRTNRRD